MFYLLIVKCHVFSVDKTSQKLKRSTDMYGRTSE